MKTPTPTTNNLALLAPLLARPWAISQRDFTALQASFSALLAQDPGAFFSLSDLITARQPLTYDDQTGTAHIHIQGALAEAAPPIWEKLGNTDYRTLRAELAAARQLPNLETVLLHVDSPGGTVAGVEETADAIQSIARDVDVHAHCEGLACSAAYWLAAGADHLTATPSADVGNIGVVLTFYDDTDFLSALGIETNVMTNTGADLKATFRTKLSDSQRAFLQESLDQTGAAFRAHVQGNRPGIDPEVFRAGWYSGARAEALGLIDDVL